jgi:hypothetical protein
MPPRAALVVSRAFLDAALAQVGKEAGEDCRDAARVYVDWIAGPVTSAAASKSSAELTEASGVLKSRRALATDKPRV